MHNKPLILIVEDEKAIGDFLVATLEAHGYRTLSAYGGKEAVSLASSHCPDLMLLDLGLPDVDGMEVLATLRAWSAMSVIIVSARQREEDIVRALDHTADDYVTKPFSNAVLLARIRTALRKGHSAEASRRDARPLSFAGGRLCLDSERRVVTARGETIHLTPIEYKLLVLLARNAGKVITYASICRELWGPYGGDSRGVRVNMANLRRKVEENPADPRLLMTEIGIGYRMAESDESP